MDGIGSITSYIDVPQLVLYGFWIFFASLIYYLVRENKREGYPLDSDRTDRSGGRVKVIGFPAPPPPKTYQLAHGGTFSAPNAKRDARPIAATPVAGFPGAPLEPTGNPMLDGVGPGAYAERADHPDMTYDGRPSIVPMRVATDFHIVDSPDPRGVPVRGADGAVAGKVVELWVDRAECILRYLEVETHGPEARRVLLPVPFAVIRRSHVEVSSILARQFAQVPGLKSTDQITLLEEEKVCAYYGGGTLFATPSRREAIL